MKPEKYQHHKIFVRLCVFQRQLHCSWFKLKKKALDADPRAIQQIVVISINGWVQ